jgi:MFS transporter, DHA1 family, inner membrane transport protein
LSPEPAAGAAGHPQASVPPRAYATALLCLFVFGNTFAVGAFAPLVPDIARAHELTDGQVGTVAAAFGFARMVGAIPAAALAGRRLGLALAAAPSLLGVGVVVLATATGFGTLVAGRFAIGLAHTLGMVAGLTAVLRDYRSASASFRLNIFEFAGMLGVLGGLGLVAVAPTSWSWSTSYLVASAPLLLVLAASPALWRRFGDALSDALTSPLRPAGAENPAAYAMPPVIVMMFVVGVVLGLAWSAASQFVIPLRGTREMGLDRGGVSSMLALAQVVDLAVLLPVGRLADRIGKGAVLGGVVLALGLGVIGIGVGSFPLFVLGCAGLGLGLAGWMLPLGIIREHTPLEHLAWRTGLYRLAVDGAIFLGPLLSGALGERRAGVLVAGMGAGTLLVGFALLRREWAGSGGRGR